MHVTYDYKSLSFSKRYFQGFKILCGACEPRISSSMTGKFQGHFLPIFCTKRGRLKVKKNENLDITIVNSITLATTLGITDRRVRQLVQEGVINAKSRGKYELVKTIQQYCNYLRQKTEVDSNKQGSKIDYDIERALHEKVKREKAELQFKVMKGELHRAQDVENVMVDMITNAKTKLLGIPAKAAPMVIGYTDIPRVQSILQKAIYETLEELTDYNKDLFSNKSTLVDDGEEENE